MVKHYQRELVKEAATRIRCWLVQTGRYTASTLELDATLEMEMAGVFAGAVTQQPQGWQPIETAPKDGTWILLRGQSGYIRRPYRVHVGRWEGEYRPLDPWQTSESDSFEDDGGPPTHWMPLPNEVEAA